jgi:endoglucanase
LNDARARVYKLPHFSHPCCNDRILGNDLHRVPNHAPTNVEGGWFDAGDFLKFTHTAAYADLLLYASDRALGHQAPAALTAEAQHGERWLAKMWDQKSRTLYLQVGIGSGNNKSFYGDHDLWRLPQADDSDSRAKDGYAAAHRPVFRAATPGKPISPNLAGRVSAAFALAAQVDATSHRGRARHELRAATSLYRLANTRHPPRRLVTAAPYGYYPENSWHDDMALGGAEIALAEQDLGHRGSSYLKAAATWAKAYIRHDASSETFNLYDTSALAETDLIRAIQVAGSHAPRLAISPSGLLHDLRRQIKGGIRRSQRDPFRAGGFYNEFDVDSHTAGMIATVAMYDRATHSAAYESFATEQRDWLFGANPWGASFMVGEGSSFPRCMQHQVANLAGSLDGSPPLAVGAVVNGPNDARIFKGGLGSLQQGVRRCPADRSDPYRRFNGRGSRYLDDTRSWQTSEPAIDMTSTAIIAAALAESG